MLISQWSSSCKLKLEQWSQSSIETQVVWHVQINVFSEQVHNLLLLWITTVTIEDFAKLSGSNRINYVHLIPESHNTTNMLITIYSTYCVQLQLQIIHHTTTLPWQQKVDHSLVWLHHTAHVLARKKQQKLHYWRSAIFSKGHSVVCTQTVPAAHWCDHSRGYRASQYRQYCMPQSFNGKESQL